MLKILWSKIRLLYLQKVVLPRKCAEMARGMEKLGMTQGDYDYVQRRVLSGDGKAAREYIKARAALLKERKKSLMAQKTACKPTPGRLP